MQRIGTAVCLIFCLVFAFTSLAQEKKISRKDLPRPVLDAFEKAYPKATIKGLSMEKENGKTYYEVESVEGTTTRDLLYLPDGTIVEIEEGIAMADLPTPVKEAIVAKYPKGRVDKAERTTRGPAVSYEMRISFSGKSIEVSFDPAGKLLEEKSVATPKGGKKEKEGKEEKD